MAPLPFTQTAAFPQAVKRLCHPRGRTVLDLDRLLGVSPRTVTTDCSPSETGLFGSRQWLATETMEIDDQCSSSKRQITNSVTFQI